MEERELSWDYHPFRVRPRRSLAALGMVVALTLLIYLLYHEVGASLVGFIVLMLALGPALVPFRYRVSDKGVEIRALGTVRFFPWQEVEAVGITEDGFQIKTRRGFGPLRRRIHELLHPQPLSHWDRFRELSGRPVGERRVVFERDGES